jgi:pilus assembly protein CpaB
VARRTLLIIASILLAALGTALIWLYVEGAENRARENAQLVPVFVLTKNLSAGSSAVNAVTTQSVPSAVAANAATIQDIGSQKLKVDAVAGELLLKTMLSTSGVGVGNFPAGGVASLTITDPNRVPAELSAGDVVDVFRLSKDGAQVLLQDITVRSVGPGGQGTTGSAVVGAGGTAGAAGTAGAGPVSPSIVGLNVSQADAKTLYAAVAQGDQMAIYLHGARTP